MSVNTLPRNYNCASLRSCINFVESAPCLFKKMDKLNYILGYLKERRGTEESLPIPPWKPETISGNLEKMAEEAIEHLKEFTKSSLYTDLTAIDPTPQ